MRRRKGQEVRVALTELVKLGALGALAPAADRRVPCRVTGLHLHVLRATADGDGDAAAVLLRGAVADSRNRTGRSDGPRRDRWRRLRSGGGATFERPPCMRGARPQNRLSWRVPVGSGFEQGTYAHRRTCPAMSSAHVGLLDGEGAGGVGEPQRPGESVRDRAQAQAGFRPPRLRGRRRAAPTGRCSHRTTCPRSRRPRGRSCSRHRAGSPGRRGLTTSGSPATVTRQLPGPVS